MFIATAPQIKCTVKTKHLSQCSCRAEKWSVILFTAPDAEMGDHATR
jgi:hypothetical protein